jgi:hypothetical protein
MRTRSAAPSGHVAAFSRSWHTPAASTADTALGKTAKKTVTLPSGGDHHPATIFDYRGQKTIVPLKRHLHRLRDCLPQPRGTLDIGQQQRDRPGKQVCLPGLA